MTAKKRRIDWEALRARLSRTADDAVGDADHLAAVYRQRALELATPRERTQEQADTVAVLAFRLGGELYGLPLVALAGVLPLERWTPVPGSPDELVGVINHKGQICSVLDLARLLGVPAPDAHSKQAAYVLLLRRSGREIGLKVGPVEGLLRVARGASPGEEATGPYLETLTPDRLRVLSAEALLSHPRLVGVTPAMKMSIGQRILLGLGLVELFALGLGVFMLYTLSRLRGIESTIKDRDLTVLDSFNGLNRKQGDMLALREKAIRLYFISKANLPLAKGETAEAAGQAREEWRKFHGQVADMLKQVQEDATRFGRGSLSNGRQQGWEQIAQNARETAEARETLFLRAEGIFDVLAQGNLEAGAGSARRLNEDRLRFDQKLNEGIELTKRQIERGNELSAETYRGAWVSSMVGLGLMLALGLTAGLVVRRSVTRPLGQFMHFVEGVGRGDLTGKAPDTQVSDLERLGGSLDRMVEGLRDLAGQIITATQNLNAASQEILASVQETAAGTRQQAASVQQITATVEEVGQSGSQIAERAKQVAAAAEATASTTSVGLKSVQVATRSMESIREQVETFAEHIVALSEKTQAVGEIIGAVTDVAERSNLLALNASIEAAGAGEHGSRFAVVAGEMKNLADQAKESTVQVQTILVGIQKGINSSVMLTEEAVKRAEAGREQAQTTERTIRQMAETTQESVNAFQQIIAATNQQQIGLDQVTQGMKDIRQAATQTASATSQLEAAVVNVNALSQQLQKAAGRYRL